MGVELSAVSAAADAVAGARMVPCEQAVSTRLSAITDTTLRDFLTNIFHLQ
jgi:hypothetical protein